MVGLSGLIEHVDRAFEVWTFQKTAHSTSKHIKYEQAPGKEHRKTYLNAVKGVVLVTRNHASLTPKSTPRQAILALEHTVSLSTHAARCLSEKIATSVLSKKFVETRVSKADPLR